MTEVKLYDQATFHHIIVKLTLKKVHSGWPRRFPRKYKAMTRSSELNLLTSPHPSSTVNRNFTLPNLWKSLSWPSDVNPATPVVRTLEYQPSEVSTRLPSASRRATHLRWPAPGSSRGRAADPAPRRCWCRPGTATVLPLCDGQWRAGCLY